MKTRGSSSKAEPPRDASYPMNAGPRRHGSDALALSHAFRELRRRTGGRARRQREQLKVHGLREAVFEREGEVAGRAGQHRRLHAAPAEAGGGARRPAIAARRRLASRGARG